MSIIESLRNLSSNAELMRSSAVNALKEANRGRDTALFLIERASSARLYWEHNQDLLSEVEEPDKLRHVMQATQATIDALLLSKDMQVDYAANWINNAIASAARASEVLQEGTAAIAEWLRSRGSENSSADDDQFAEAITEFIAIAQAAGFAQQAALESGLVKESLPERGATHRFSEPPECPSESMSVLTSSAAELTNLR